MFLSHSVGKGFWAVEQIGHLLFAWNDGVNFPAGENHDGVFSRNCSRGEFSYETDLIHPCFYRDMSMCLQSLDL